VPGRRRRRQWRRLERRRAERLPPRQRFRGLARRGHVTNRRRLRHQAAALCGRGLLARRHHLGRGRLGVLGLADHQRAVRERRHQPLAGVQRDARPVSEPRTTTVPDFMTTSNPW
jgi:hypothetical protein